MAKVYNTQLELFPQLLAGFKVFIKLIGFQLSYYRIETSIDSVYLLPVLHAERYDG
jgi:hypothetical protein